MSWETNIYLKPSCDVSEHLRAFYRIDALAHLAGARISPAAGRPLHHIQHTTATPSRSAACENEGLEVGGSAFDLFFKVTAQLAFGDVSPQLKRERALPDVG